MCVIMTCFCHKHENGSNENSTDPALHGRSSTPMQSVSWDQNAKINKPAAMTALRNLDLHITTSVGTYIFPRFSQFHLDSNNSDAGITPPAFGGP